jgi:hypothetical protein
MSDGVNIDWSLAKPSQDFVGDYANAFQVGRTLAAASPPDGRPNLAKTIAGLPPEGRAQAARRAEIIGAIGQGLCDYPYGQRRSVLAHLSDDLATQGLPPEAIAGFDPTDDNLAQLVGHTVILRGMLGNAPDASPPPDPPAPAG